MSLAPTITMIIGVIHLLMMIYGVFRGGISRIIATGSLLFLVLGYILSVSNNTVPSLVWIVPATVLSVGWYVFYVFSAHMKEENLVEIAKQAVQERDYAVSALTKLQSNYSLMRCETGEIIHSLGNFLVEDKINLGALSKHDGALLEELGSSMRHSKASIAQSVGSYKTLLGEGFRIETENETKITAIASRMIGNLGRVSFNEAWEIENQTSSNNR